jgi:4-aminobutyrate aminotransferase-like enzyme
MDISKVGDVREVPGPKSREIIRTLSESGVPLYKDFLGTGIHSPIFKKAEGLYLQDVDDYVYLDTHAAMACITLGYDSANLKKAIVEQASQLPAILAMGPSLPRIKLANLIVREIAPGSLKGSSFIQFETGGSAAIDFAVKAALFYSSVVQKQTMNKMIAFTGGYHGTGSFGMTLSDNAIFRANLPKAIEVVRVPYPYCYRCAFELSYPGCDMFCVRYIEKLMSTPSYGLYNPFTKKVDVASLIVEPLQSHGGTIVPPVEFYPMLRNLCDKYGITFIDDEICGFMWSGKYWYCCEHYRTTPDIIVMAKGFSGGFGPLGGIIIKDSISNEINKHSFWHMTTYQGHPIACAAALENVQTIMKNKMLDKVHLDGKYFIARLKELQKTHQSIGDARGLGFMGALEFVKDKKTKEPDSEMAIKVGLEALKRGTTGYTGLGDHGNVMHWHLPLIISREQIDKLIEILDESILKIEKESWNGARK